MAIRGEGEAPKLVTPAPAVCRNAPADAWFPCSEPSPVSLRRTVLAGTFGE